MVPCTQKQSDIDNEVMDNITFDNTLDEVVAKIDDCAAEQEKAGLAKEAEDVESKREEREKRHQQEESESEANKRQGSLVSDGMSYFGFTRNPFALRSATSKSEKNTKT